MWIRGRSLRPGRTEDEDEFQLDLTKDYAESIRDILINLCKKQGTTSERRRLSYLNGFVKIITKCEYDFSKLGFTADEILFCLRPSLLHDTTQVRSGGLRALRYMLRTKHEATICIKLQYPLLVARSMDLVTGNDNERVQALRVVRRLLCLDAAQFPVSLARSLVAIASGAPEDHLMNLSLGALSELCVLNPQLLISVGGVTTILRSLANVRSARMAEAMVGALLYLQNRPETRRSAALNLDCLAAPYTDLQAIDKAAKEKEGANYDRFKWPHVTLLSTLRSWPGVLHFCHPLKDGLRSIVATLYLNQLDVRKAVLDLLYELLCLAQPEWSDEISVAMEAVDPSRLQEAFKLSEGFVAAEGKMVLPHLSKSRVNLSELHLSLLLYCFLEAGLLDAIVEVIIAEDTFLSVRATILLGELLHLIHLLLPPECCHLTPSLPNLLSYAVRGRPHAAIKPDYFDSPVISVSPANSSSDSKKDIPSLRVGVRSGHSSVRTVSESSTGKPCAGETGDRHLGSDHSPHNSERKELSDSKPKTKPDQTAHFLKDVREVLADMTNAADVRSPYRTVRGRFWTHSEMDGFGVGTPLSEPPACSRAQQRAMGAVMALSRLHRLLRQRPAPASIHLDHVLASVTGRAGPDGVELARAKGKTHSRNKLNQLLTKECDEAIKDSHVLTNKDCFGWNWDIIRAILKSRPQCLRKCEESNHRQFLRRLVQFVLPSSRQMSRVDFNTDRRKVNNYTLAAMELLDCLLCGYQESECDKLLSELLTVIKTQLEAISTAKSVHDCMLSPLAVTNSLCQDYFLLVGHLTRSQAGVDLLDNMGILQVLLSLVTTSKHDCYVKLIISSLDYSSDERIRNVMSSTLVCDQDSSRLYATKFLRVLLRTPLTKRADYARWVVELLATQLSDKNRAVSLSAIAALDEACDVKEYLDALINLRPSLLHLGDKGLLLLIRFLSTEKGFNYMNEANFVSTQLSKWVKFNYKYVCIVEGELADGLTLVERNEDGRYSSRLSNTKRVPGDVYVPPHLYGQLTQHPAGLNLLLAHENIPKLVQVVLQGLCGSDNEIMDLKAAVWALGHLSCSTGGALWARANGITKSLVGLACTSPVYAIRLAAFHAIALTATTVEGADTLLTLGWYTVRHNRNERWPVVAPLNLLEDALLQYQEDKYLNRDSSESTDTSESTTKNGNGLFILGEDTITEGNESFIGFTARERAMRERKSATLPPAGSSHTYHHNRSYSESKADNDWPRSTTPAPSHSGSDITDFRNENIRLYSESSTSGTSSGGESYQPRTYISERLMQTLSPIPSSGSIATVKSHRRISVASSQGPQLSPQDMMGYAALRKIHHSRRPKLFASPHLSLHFSQSAPAHLSPLSPIELIAFQDWKQMSPLVRPKHPDNHPVEPQFEVSGVHCPLPSDSLAPQTLHYESSRSCIAPPPDDSVEESTGPCYLGICLPQHIIDLFPVEELPVRPEDPHLDNASTTGMDVSSCDSETDTGPEGEADRSMTKPRPVAKRRHDRTSCLLCSVSKIANPRQTRWRKISASSHRTRTETESSYGGAGNDGESPVMVQWQSKGGLEGITSVDSSSTDITTTGPRSVGDNFKSRSVIRKEILRLADQLCNPVLTRTCKQSLLQLKQQYSDVFNDVCVYSDICAIMASASLKITSRRFLQELFLDAPFSEIYEDPLALLSVQNNTDSEDGTIAEKISLGSEASVVEDSSAEPNTWKNSGTKMNGFDTDQRGQGYELEVILESDARSENSDVCRSSGGLEGGRGRSSTGDSRCSVTHLEDVTDNVQSQTTGEAESHITVSRSSQQLRKEFFNATLSPESTSSMDKGKVPNSENKAATESFVSKVADSISKSQGMLEMKLNAKEGSILQSLSLTSISQPVITSIDSSTSELQTFSQSVDISESNVTQNESFEKLKSDKIENKTVNQHPVGDRSPRSLEKPKQDKKERILTQDILSKETITSVNNVSKSPQPLGKSKRLNNTKLLTPIKSEITSSKKSKDQITSLSSDQSNQIKDGVSSKLKTEVKVESLVIKKENNKSPSVADTGNDASTSKALLKSTKSNETPLSTGKPPIGSGRQRRKATTKTPNKDSLETVKKKSECESR
ncbi:rapamycin-insensitive companion of mTOR-like isoform X3 [Homalodisca vitripennis]|uniref:rapamycin-insensitive companion of mTOR-like isoform X3 n=1 Tax=Homalodisca vitripennis TaxID=197043 RepID=UPI001EEA18D3|nr:rapamycin-insensitive companion of mTOR-like isoform X3 [Homalodisca vitripennis]